MNAPRERGIFIGGRNRPKGSALQSCIQAACARPPVYRAALETAPPADDSLLFGLPRFAVVCAIAEWNSVSSSQRALYCSSLTFSIQVTFLPATVPVTAMWLI